MLKVKRRLKLIRYGMQKAGNCTLVVCIEWANVWRSKWNPDGYAPCCLDLGHIRGGGGFQKEYFLPWLDESSKGDGEGSAASHGYDYLRHRIDRAVRSEGAAHQFFAEDLSGDEWRMAETIGEQFAQCDHEAWVSLKVNSTLCQNCKIIVQPKISKFVSRHFPMHWKHTISL